LANVRAAAKASNAAHTREPNKNPSEVNGMVVAATAKVEAGISLDRAYCENKQTHQGIRLTKVASLREEDEDGAPDVAAISLADSVVKAP
jgi:anti-sigma28 factor (negative regulator of flagellin synthesis)